MWTLLILGGFLLIILLIVWVVYNNLVAAREIVQEALSGVDIQLKKRYELIPNLVNIVKTYSDYESSLFQKVTALRSAEESQDIVSAEKEDAGLNLISRSIRVKVEDYPELKADKQFLHLMEELSKVEDELAMSRRYLNGTIRDYNTKIDVFPNVMLSGIMNFKEMPFYEIESFEKEPQKIFE
jgi:LemA protein